MVFVTHDQEEAMTLGDSVVIMNDGEIQQNGTPYEIYNEPTNRFVADFIGSPSTNMFDGTARITDGKLSVETEFCQVDLRDPSQDVDVTDGQQLVLGVRPEHLGLSVDQSEGHFQATVSVVEPHGQNDAVYMNVNGTEISVVTEPGLVTGDDEVGVNIDTDEVWLFDEDGKRLL